MLHHKLLIKERWIFPIISLLVEIIIQRQCEEEGEEKEGNFKRQAQ